MSTYSEKLQHPKWQRLRLEVLKRDNFTCQRCDATDRQLKVHHQYYVSDRDPWNYPKWNFVSVCGPCHEFLHNSKITSFYNFECLLDMLVGNKNDLLDLIEAVDDAFLHENKKRGKLRKKLISLMRGFLSANADRIAQGEPEPVIKA